MSSWGDPQLVRAARIYLYAHPKEPVSDIYAHGLGKPSAYEMMNPLDEKKKLTLLRYLLMYYGKEQFPSDLTPYFFYLASEEQLLSLLNGV